MSKKKKNDEKSTEATDPFSDADEQSVVEEDTSPQPVNEESTADEMKNTAEEVKKPVSFPLVNPLGRKQKVEGLVALSVLAERFKTSAIVLSALKAEYGWTDSTKMTAERYRIALNDWLSAPAGKRRKQ